MSNLISDMARSVGLPRLKRAAGVVTRRVPIPQPMLLVGPGASARLGRTVGDFGHRRVLVVTDAVIVGLGLMAPLLDALAASGTPVEVFDAITPDAPIPVVEQGIARFLGQGCDAIVAFGGGSVIDAAKAIGLAAANHRHPRELVGYFKARKGPPPIYAVPTTAGTGSEVTVAAVIADPEHGRKLVIADTRLVPDIAALDPTLMTGLPPAITAATGMDALTHAVEAFIGQWAGPATDRLALNAVGLIYRWLPVAFAEGANLVAREQMALASTFAGLAFTRANVGNVHAIAHQLGGRYHTPHGLANAILLSPVLRFSRPEIVPRLALLARRVGLGHAGDPDGLLADLFLDSVDALNATLGIPRTLAALQEADIPALAEAACLEADANYPVPARLTQEACEGLLRSVLAPAAAKAAGRRAPRSKAAAARPPAEKPAESLAGSPAESPRTPVKRRRRVPAQDAPA